MSRARSRSSASAEAPTSKTPRVVTKSHPCAVAAEGYWALRDDDGFDQFTAKADGNTHEVVSTLTDADGCVTRVSKVTALKNPIPKALRKTARASTAEEGAAAKKPRKS